MLKKFLASKIIALSVTGILFINAISSVAFASRNPDINISENISIDIGYTVLAEESRQEDFIYDDNIQFTVATATKSQEERMKQFMLDMDSIFNTRYNAKSEPVGILFQSYKAKSKGSSTFTVQANPKASLIQALETPAVKNHLKDPSVLDRMAKAVENTFIDVYGSDWFASDLSLAVYKNGIVRGYEDNTFRPQSSITRQEFAAMYARACNWNSRDESYYAGDNNLYKDRLEDMGIDSWAIPGIVFCLEAGILLKPTEGANKQYYEGNILRAEVAYALSESLLELRKNGGEYYTVDPNDKVFSDLDIVDFGNDWDKAEPMLKSLYGYEADGRNMVLFEGIVKSGKMPVNLVLPNGSLYSIFSYNNIHSLYKLGVMKGSLNEDGSVTSDAFREVKRCEAISLFVRAGQTDTRRDYTRED